MAASQASGPTKPGPAPAVNWCSFVCKEKTATTVQTICTTEQNSVAQAAPIYEHEDIHRCYVRISRVTQIFNGTKK